MKTKEQVVSEVLGVMEYVPLDFLRADGPNSRTYQPDKKAIQAMADDILANGIMNPLIVTQEETGTYQVKAGFQRHAALVTLLESGKIDGNYQVPVRVLLDPEKAQDVNEAENIVRNSLGVMDLAYIARRHQEAGMTTRQIGEKMGKSNNWVSTMIRFTTLPKPMQDKIQTGDIPVKLARVLTMAESEEEQGKILARFEAGMSANEIEQTKQSESDNKRKKKKGEEAAGSKGLSAKKAIILLEEAMEEEEEGGKEILAAFKKFLEGKIGIAALRNRIAGVRDILAVSLT
jgi:ParB family chromosome partitioning protein